MKIIPLKDVKKTEVDMEGASGVTKQLPIGSGDGSPLFSFRVSPGEKHQYRNTSDTEDLVFICAVPKEYE